MRHAWGLVVLLVCALSVHADTPRQRVLVADTVAMGVDPALAKTLTSMLVGRLGARDGIDALSGAELRQLMALEAEKASCGNDDSCVAELTGALGAPLALMSDVGSLGSLTVVNLTLFDTHRALPIARMPIEADKLEDLPHKLDVALDALMLKAAKSQVATSSVLAPAPAPAPANDVKAPAAAKAKHASDDDFDQMFGSSSTNTGLGLSGAGEGGGGAGLGLAGLGTTKPSNASAPAVDVEPAPSKAILQVLRAHKAEWKACAKKAKDGARAVSGSLRVRVLVAQNGSVAWAQVARGDMKLPAVRRCVIEAVSSWTFPPQEAPTSVVLPFVW